VKDAGQQVGKLAPHADYYVVNETNRDALRHEGRRFFSLLLGFGTYQPLRDERAMHLAFSAGAGSYCLSRQVGAAILDDRGNVLGVGHNDVPKAGGGLYTSEDAHDRRCHLVGNRTCINDTNKQERFEGLAASLAEELECKGKHSSILTVIERSEFAQATEYCRAVHAEMEAILSVGRNAHSSTVGSTMYVTTQPCHNCTKHIICAGIKRVVYVEPYPKSLGDELHSDAFAFVNGRAPIGDRVCFSFYQGVAPHRFHEMFAIMRVR
jgi:deoxycytidylate deaminase